MSPSSVCTLPPASSIDTGEVGSTRTCEEHAALEDHSHVVQPLRVQFASTAHVVEYGITQGAHLLPLPARRKARTSTAGPTILALKTDVDAQDDATNHGAVPDLRDLLDAINSRAESVGRRADLQCPYGSLGVLHRRQSHDLWRALAFSPDPRVPYR